jgi:hypothetical protein
MNLTVSLIWASDDDYDGIDDDYENKNLREIDIEFSENKTEIESILKSGSIDDIEYTITYDYEGLSIELRYGSDYEGELTDFDIEFEVSFRKLVEYVDIDSNGIFNESIDDLIQEVSINNFSAINYTLVDIDNETKLHYIIVSTTDNTFIAHFYFSEEFTLVNNSLVTPSQTKMDIEINNFNYLNASSRLALYIKLESESDYEEHEETEDEILGFATSEEGVSITNNDLLGFFSWTQNASIDNVIEEVHFSPIEIDDDDENEQKIYINYPRGNHIYHDPKVGIEGILKPILTPPFSFGLIIMIVALSAITISVAYTVYRFRENIFSFLTPESKKILQKIHKIQATDYSKGMTAISEDFMKIINQFEWEEQEKENFIREMLALSPSERQSILKEMLERSE